MTLARRTTGSIAALALGVGLLATAGTAAYAADPVAGAQTAGDAMFPHVGNGGYDVQNYDVDLAWTPLGVVDNLMTGSIVATTTIAARTTAAPLSSFSLDLEGLEVDSVTVDGAPATWTRVVDPSQVIYKLVITPRAAVDGAFTTVVKYHGEPTEHVDADDSLEGWNATSDGAAFVNQPIGAMTAYPNNNTPADKATYTFDIDVPTQITNAAGTGPAAAASNGELVAGTPSADGTRTTWSWVQGRQMATELAMISIGKYDVLESDVVLASGRTLHEWSFIDPSITATAAAAIPARRASFKTIIDGLETIFGPYPGGSTGIVVDRSTGINYALETQDRSFFPGSVSAGTLVHEFAHQWYGDAVSPATWTDIWINEGMATWAPTHYNNVVTRTSTTTTETSYFNSWNSTASTSPSWSIPPAGQTDAAELYGYQTYTRGAQLWEALKAAVGDRSFFAFVAAWQQTYGGGNGSSAQFEALAEEISGRDLTAFFQDWIHDADKPAWPAKYTLALAGTPTEGQVQPGGSVTYTLSSLNTGKVAQIGSVVTVDLADVLDDATLDPAALPAGLTLSGTTLSWAVPSTAVGATSTVDFVVTVAGSASDATLAPVVSNAAVGSTVGTVAAPLTVPVQALAPAAVPTVSGTARVGETLQTATRGWASGTTFGYQWLRDGTEIGGAAAAAYVVTAADLGSTLSVRVVGSKTHYSPVARTSGPTAVVVRGAQPTVGKPRSLSGRLGVGSKLRVARPGFVAGTTVTYAFRVGGQLVKKGSVPRLALVPSYRGKRVKVVVTGVLAGYAPVTTRAVLGRVR